MQSKQLYYRFSRYLVIACLLLLSFSYTTLTAQKTKIDSLLTLLKTDKSDTTKVKHLIQLGWYMKLQNPDTALLFSNQALDIINELPPNLKIPETELLQTRVYSNMGVLYSIRSNYPLALDYQLKALTIAEKLNNKKQISVALNNIGLVYEQQADYQKALDYYVKTLKIKEELKEESGIVTVLGNIGTLHSKQHNHPKALAYFSEALKKAETIGNKEAQARNLGSIGIIFLEKAEYPKAEDYFKKALVICKDLGNRIGIANNLSNIGALYKLTGEYAKAEEYLKSAISMHEKTGAIEHLMISEEVLSALYDTLAQDAFARGQFSVAAKNYKTFVLHYKKGVALKDSIFNQESKKQLVQKAMTYEFEKKETATKAENEKQQAIAEERNRKQRLISWTIAGGLFLVLVFSIFILRSLRITRKQKQIIEQKNNETLLQKKIIEEKNKDITDSIHYAKRIQSALIREEEHVSVHLPEHFILFLPKDIVSGDFYWGSEKNEFWYFAVADCTGHGVPGAIMSMLGITFLNDIVQAEKLLNPAEILNNLRDRVVAELRQMDESIGNKDGMDISLGRLNLKTLELHWAGANNSLFIINAGTKSVEAMPEIEEIKADKQPIGYYPGAKPFTNHVVRLKKGDCIYLYSDGYADQFGGPEGKKFKKKQLALHLVKDYTLPMKQQKQLFKKYFNDWKGSMEQVDDVCVFGIRV